MRQAILIPLVTVLLIGSCKTEQKKDTIPPEEELSMVEKVSRAHGMENWNDISSLEFTFNVDRDTTHFERHWIWNTKTQEVTGISMGDTITYSRSSLDSTAAKADAAFINDKYWLLAPMNIGWDEKNVTQEHSMKAVAPISKKEMQKLTVVYGNEGGYTPGDAYDFYLGEDMMVREWAYRKGNNPEPSSTATWEDYSEQEGLKISTMHKNAEGNFKLYFTNVKVSVD